MLYNNWAGLSQKHSPLALTLVVGAFLSGCAPVQERIVYRDRPVEVRVPVTVTPETPLYLRAAVPRPALGWQSTGDVCLSNEDATRLRDATWQWLTRIDAWEAWASPTAGSPTLPR